MASGFREQRSAAVGPRAARRSDALIQKRTRFRNSIRAGVPAAGGDFLEAIAARRGVGVKVTSQRAIARIAASCAPVAQDVGLAPAHAATSSRRPSSDPCGPNAGPESPSQVKAAPRPARAPCLAGAVQHGAQCSSSPRRGVRYGLESVPHRPRSRQACHGDQIRAPELL